MLTNNSYVMKKMYVYAYSNECCSTVIKVTLNAKHNLKNAQLLFM